MQKLLFSVFLFIAVIPGVQAQSNVSADTLPNIFTPNDDGVNDVFQLPSSQFSSLNCLVYNRFGIKVYEFNGVEGFWDGATTAGMPCPAGTYYFLYKATGKDGEKYEDSGFIQLIR